MPIHEPPHKQTDDQPADADVLLSPRRVRAALADISEATLWRMVDRGDLPRPVRVSRGRVGFPAKAIHAYIARCASGR